jgi:hypothetical protein
MHETALNQKHANEYAESFNAARKERAGDAATHKALDQFAKAINHAITSVNLILCVPLHDAQVFTDSQALPRVVIAARYPCDHLIRAMTPRYSMSKNIVTNEDEDPG